MVIFVSKWTNRDPIRFSRRYRLFNLRWCNTLTPRKWNPSTHWSTAGVREGEGGWQGGKEGWRRKRKKRRRRRGKSGGINSEVLPAYHHPAGGFRYSVDFDFHENRAPPANPFARVCFWRDFPARTFFSHFRIQGNEFFTKINAPIDSEINSSAETKEVKISYKFITPF